MDTPKTFLLKTKKTAGFTLIEILIVLAILGGLVAFGLPRIRFNQNNIKNVSRQVRTMMKEIRTQARLKNMTYRLVVQMNGEEHTYWVESAAGSVAAKNQLQMQEDAEADEDEKPANPFQKASGFGKEDKALPKGLYFASVETTRDPAPITEGAAYIYFSPEGLVDQAVLIISDHAKINWSLITNPLTGQTSIAERPVALAELKVQQ